MGDDGRSGRKWEEEIYWGHFRSPQFFQKLSAGSDYRHQLAIPEKFASNLKEKLEGAVSLNGPSGTQWKVGLATSNGTLYLKDGWKRFVEDHSLKEDDVLLFKYIGEMRFDIRMFDHQSLCEKESSYFIKQCGNGETNAGCKRKSESVETIKFSDESSKDSFGSSDGESESSDYVLPPQSRVRERGQRLGTRNSIGRDVSSSSSHRRQVTEEDKENALKKAHASASDNSFVVVMRPTYVYKGRYMLIPAKWGRKYMPKTSQDLTLRVKEKTWVVRFSTEFKGAGAFSTGWRGFAAENFLEEFDVCLFNLVNERKDGTLMDVSIFRAVGDLIRVGSDHVEDRKPLI